MQAGRRSLLYPVGTRLAHADLHNHTLLSDGTGAPEEAFASMRAAGLDVAALTDHALLGYGRLSRLDPCARFPPPRPGRADRCRAVIGIDEAGWERTGHLAEDADEPGVFTALRGFEWSHPTLGHLNVWCSRRWIDPLHTSGVGWDGLGDAVRGMPGLGPLLDRILDTRGREPRMGPLYDWLVRDPSAPGIGGGADGLTGFNHPGREPGTFDAFRYDPRLAHRMVGLEAFNRDEDFLFDRHGRSPLAACLDAGWRVGLLGVTDEHGRDWGHPPGKGRAGLWVRARTRDGVREALTARRFFATTLRGLRLDAAAAGVRMGGRVPHRRGPLTFAVDLGHPPSRGATWHIQVLRPDAPLPQVVHVEEVRVPDDAGPTVRFTVDLDAIDGPWVVLRVADPAGRNPRPGPEGHPGNLQAVAYASPFWLDPDAALRSPGGR